MPSYTLDELLKMMEPQAQRDKALINQCIEGLGLYAAQQKRDNTFSSKPDEMRKLVENLVEYWGLDDAFPHIGEASFIVEAERQCADYNEAFKVAMEAGGKKFLLDMFSADVVPPPTPDDKDSVLERIKASRQTPVPRQPKDKEAHSHKKDKGGQEV